MIVRTIACYIGKYYNYQEPKNKNECSEDSLQCTFIFCHALTVESDIIKWASSQ